MDGPCKKGPIFHLTCGPGRISKNANAHPQKRNYNLSANVAKVSRKRFWQSETFHYRMHFAEIPNWSRCFANPQFSYDALDDISLSDQSYMKAISEVFQQLATIISMP